MECKILEEDRTLSNIKILNEPEESGWIALIYKGAWRRQNVALKVLQPKDQPLKIYEVNSSLAINALASSSTCRDSANDFQFGGDSGIKGFFPF